MEKYYNAYDKRYRQIHKLNLQWTTNSHSQILDDIINKYGITAKSKILELGCGEGRDAFYLLDKGFDLLASDVSREAVGFCKKQYPKYSDSFTVLDACKDKIGKTYNFIYSVAVIHMLVLQEDRDAFLKFIKLHLKKSGIALILTMGDGKMEISGDISKAFENTARTHQATGREVEVASTTCRIVSFETFEEELVRNGFDIIERGITSIEGEFDSIMYAIVK